MDKEKIITLLAYSLDNELTLEEQQLLDEAFAKHPELAAEQEELLMMRNLLSVQKPEPNNDFVNTVLGKISATSATIEKGFNTAMIQMFPKVAAACVIVLLVSLLNVYLGGNELTTEALLGLSEISPDEAYSILTEE